MELAIILSIIFIHELGHYTMAQILQWRIRRIMLWVFGGVMDTDEHGNKPIYEEVLVTIAGPFQHIIIFFIVFLFTTGDILPTSILHLIVYYNTAILLFNLLPIWPLDGGRLFFLYLSSFLPYRKAYHAIIIFSISLSLLIIILQFIFLPFTLSAFLLMIFLCMENRTEWKYRYYVFIRFLLNRYEGKSTVKGIQPITVSSENSLMNVFYLFRREKKHPIYIMFSNRKRIAIDENDCLRSYFYENQYNKKIGEVAKSIL